MINKILGFLVLLALTYGVYWMVTYYKRDFEAKPPAPQTAAADPAAAAGDANVPADSMAGLPPRLEAPLKAAYAQGATALSNWLRTSRAYVGDPRLGAIELDLAALLSRTDPAAAKRIYQEVRKRTPSDSPLYARVKKLEAVYR